MQAGVRYVIAPKDTTAPSDAALFCSVFYHLVFVEQKNPYSAFKKIKKTFPRMSGKWEFFDLYKHARADLGIRSEHIVVLLLFAVAGKLAFESSSAPLYN